MSYLKYEYIGVSNGNGLVYVHYRKAPIKVASHKTFWRDLNEILLRYFSYISTRIVQYEK